MNKNAKPKVDDVIKNLFDMGVIPDCMHAMKTISTDPYEFNCWSLTANLLGLSKDIHWFYDGDMLDILKSNTQNVDDPKVGDIVSFYGNVDHALWHTAIVSDIDKKGRISLLHKDGEDDIQITSLNLLKSVLPYSTTHHKFHRIVKE